MKKEIELVRYYRRHTKPHNSEALPFGYSILQINQLCTSYSIPDRGTVGNEYKTQSNI